MDDAVNCFNNLLVWMGGGNWLSTFNPEELIENQMNLFIGYINYQDIYQ